MKFNLLIVLTIFIVMNGFVAYGEKNGIPIEPQEESTIFTVNQDDGWFYYPSLDNYAPSGMPDFDQKQDNWKNPTYNGWSFCGPTALANVLWYFDSMNSDPSGQPDDGIDTYPLVNDYQAPSNPNPGPSSDDHNINNVNDPLTPWNPSNSQYGNELIEKVAWYTDNDGCRSGTNHVGSSNTGIKNGFSMWLADTDLTGYYEIFEYSMRNVDAFDVVSTNITNRSCVLLNLGFYTESGANNGNHWVAVAGVNTANLQIALSDPYVDRVNPTHDETFHNNASIVSHDIYRVSLDSPLPHRSSWWLEDYVPDYAQDSLTVIKNAIILTLNDNTEGPEKPSLTGPNEGNVGEEYTFNTSTIDPDGDQVLYMFDWGDEGTSDWLGPYESGEICSTSHIWLQRGNYEVKVKAKDTYGAESEWSNPLSITMPKRKDITPLNLIIERLKIHFSFLDTFLKVTLK